MKRRRSVHGARVKTFLGCIATIACCAGLAACHSSSDGDTQAPANPPPPGVVVGLDARPSNTSCVAPAKTSGSAGATIALARAFPSLTFSQPLAMLQAPGDDSRWFVLEKGSGASGTGRVLVFAEQREHERDEHVRFRHRERELRGRLARYGVPPQLGDEPPGVLVVHGRHANGVDDRALSDCRRRRVDRRVDAAEHPARQSAVRESQRRQHRLQPERRRSVCRIWRRR